MQAVSLQNICIYHITGDMKVVLDTDVVVAALRSPTGASAELLRMARHKRFTPVVSVPLVLEYEAVVTRPEHLAASGLSAEDAMAVLDVLVGHSEWTRVYYLYRPWLKDPGDEMVLEAAENSAARAIVTFNKRDFAAIPEYLRLQLWLPREALEKLR
jgi:putative PIN family toxin of toxin-antitoxin system